LNLVPQPTDTPEEKPTVDLPATIAQVIPAGMIESLKASRHSLALIHGQFVKDFGMVPSFLTGAYTAIEDAEGFLKTIANGKEEFTPVPKKPEVKEEDKVTTDGTIKVPSNLKDIPYMQEWSGQFFFPKLRELTVRKDVEVDLRANMNKKKKLHLVLSVTLPNEPAVLLPTQYSANTVIDLAKVAKSIDAL
jgi:hypothetical protein